MEDGKTRRMMRQRVVEPGLDFYATPDWVTRGFVEHVLPTVPHWREYAVWEPACGDGRMADVLKPHFPRVWASDIVDRGYPGMDCTGDVFTMDPPTDDCLSIITNPPYCQVDDFILRCLDMSPRLAMIGRMAWLEGVARYEKIYSNIWRRPKAVFCFVRRIKFYKDGDPDAVDNVSGVPHAWFVWDLVDGDGFPDPTIHWIP